MSHADHSHDHHEHGSEDTMSEILHRIFVEFFIHVLPWTLLIFLVIHFSVNFLINSLSEDLTEDFARALLGIKLLLLLAAYYFLAAAGRLFVVVEPNEVLTYQGFFTGWRYVKFPGWNWVSPFSVQKFNTPTNRHLEVLLQDNAPAAGGQDTMSFKARVLFRVDKTKEGIIKFTETTEGNIIAALTLRTGVIVTSWLWEQTSPDTAKTNRSECFPSWAFETECGLYGLVVEIAELQDLDYSKNVQEAKAASGEVAGFNAAINALLNENSEMSRAEATKIVKALLLKGNYREFEITGGGNTNFMINPNQS